jgi:excisionase family DNA binding protein
MMDGGTQVDSHDRYDRLSGQVDSHDRLGGQSSTVLDGHDYTVSVEDAAEILGKSVETVRRYARAGRLPSMRIQGERIIEYRFRPDDLRASHAVTGGHAGIDGQTGSQSVMPTKADGYGGDRLMTALQQVIAPLVEANARQADELAALHALTRQQAEELGRTQAHHAHAERRVAELEQQLAHQAAPSISMAQEQPASVLASTVAPPAQPRSILGRAAVWVAKRSG